MEVQPDGLMSLPEMWLMAVVRPAPPGDGPASWISIRRWAASLNRTSPMPSPGSMMLIKAFAASRSFCTFVMPSPASSFMLPERSITSDTAERGRAMVFALMLITHVWLVSTHRTVTLPLAVSPGFVDV